MMRWLRVDPGVARWPGQGSGFVNLIGMNAICLAPGSIPRRSLAGLRTVIALAAALAALAQPWAVQAQAAPSTRPGASTNSLSLPIDPALLNNLPELKGVVSWNTLAQVKSRTEGNKVVPEFAPAVRQLNQQEVKLQGFMMPIVTGEKHEHFLLTMRPPHCPFCLSLGPEYIVEVRARSPIPHTYEPVVLSGRLAVLTDDPFGLYYRLTGAQISAASR